MDKNNAIEIRDMYKSFKSMHDKPKTLKEWLVRSHGETTSKEVLKNINLDIKKGETVALIGTNGSGKSTLLKLMTRILYPNSGTVQTNGKLTSLLELGAGFHPDFTGRENIYFNAAVFGLSRAEIESRMQEIIDFSELGEFIDEPVRTYSSGMYMRLAFSIAINVDAEILLVDEILAVGDQHFQNKCFDKLEQLRDSDKTIVIVSHSLPMMKILATRAVWIYEGTVRLDGDPAYVINQYLRQSAIDNQEKMEQEHEEKTEGSTGVLFLDSPANFESVSRSEPLPISGWALSNSPKERTVLYFDDEPVELDRTPRPDVYDVYQEDYAGLLDPEKLGFHAVIPVEKLQKPSHRIECRLYDGDALITSKKIRIKAEDPGRAEPDSAA